MIYQIKRGKQDVNLINDKNPKQGYKFVLFVGENGSGKTNFLDLIDKILKNDNSFNFEEIDKISINCINMNLAIQYRDLLNPNANHKNYFALYPVGFKWFFNLNDNNFLDSLYRDKNGLWKQWNDVFSNSILVYSKDVYDWYDKNVRGRTIIDSDHKKCINPNTCLSVKQEFGKWYINNKIGSLIDVTPFYLYEHFPVKIYLNNFIGKSKLNVLRIYTPIYQLNDGGARTNIYNRKELEDSVKKLLDDDVDVAYEPSNLGDDSKKDINKKFINACLDSFYSKEMYKIDWNKNKKINKICLNGPNPDKTIYNISDGVLHCLALATYLAYFKETDNTYLLIDEPEISLHPRAQLEFSKFLDNNKNNTNQVFIATHSPFIVKSFIEKYPNDTRIVHFQHLKEKDKDVYKADKIENFIILDFLSISEINYHVYNIPSSEYYLQLYEHLKKITGNENKDFKDFDKNYLENKDFGLEKIQKDSLTNETCLTRLRHLLAHGGDVQNEKGYKKYINKEFSPDGQTKEFYEIFTTNKDSLIDKYTKTLIVLIKNYKNK